MVAKLDPKKLLTFHPGSLYDGTARLALYLYTFELGTALAVFALYRSPALQWTMMWTRAGIVMAIGLAFVLGSGVLIVRESVSLGGDTWRMWLLATVTNLVAVSVTAACSEGILRVMAQEGEVGLQIMKVGVPYGERELFERSRRTIGGAHSAPIVETAFFVYDAELGWTVGKSRTTPDGMYSSSEEGLRSQSPGIRLRDVTPQARVALIGDSNAFSFEVPYQESWAYHLQGLVGSTTQVLNFGVDGYGIDQIYLRYRRDVRSWHPDVVLVGFVEDDLWRTMVVYPFLSMAWPGYLVKPRFDDRLPLPELINMPLPTPEGILSARSARDLPYLNYDPWSMRNWWTSWIDEGPLFLRVINTLMPHWNLPNPRFSEDAVVALNAQLLVRMRESMVQDGVTPIFVFFPTKRSTGALTHETFQAAQLSFFDMSACVAEIPWTHQYVPSGHHLTGLANEAVAKCTSGEVLRALSKKFAPSG
jgi:hypothetical protein